MIWQILTAALAWALAWLVWQMTNDRPMPLRATSGGTAGEPT